jgi:two-component system response regulator
MEIGNLSRSQQRQAANNLIMLVEDSEDDALLTQFALKKVNIANKVIWLRDGKEALDYLFVDCPAGRALLPQMVILDINMQRVDGLQVLGAIKADARVRSLPVVMFTSSKEASDVAKSYSLGVNSYICKPIDFDAFTEIVAALGSYWLRVNQQVQ